ncbi:MAG: DUF3467 domain-containing protein [Chloroflexi bacterium]|nr:DUF3467 domain-containing protein [Chloroflexota bacterium]
MTQAPQNPGNIPPMEMSEGLEPIYSNIARISHTPSEIIVDFSRFLPADPQIKVLSRILMSPVGAKLLFLALGENLSRFEAAFGEISVPGKSQLADDLFRQVHPPKTPETE